MTKMTISECHEILKERYPGRSHSVEMTLWQFCHGDHNNVEIRNRITVHGPLIAATHMSWEDCLYDLEIQHRDGDKITEEEAVAESVRQEATLSGFYQEEEEK